MERDGGEPEGEALTSSVQMHAWLKAQTPEQPSEPRSCRLPARTDRVLRAATAGSQTHETARLCPGEL